MRTRAFFFVTAILTACTGKAADLLRDAAIIASPEWTAPERQAAQDLRMYLREITGGEIPLVTAAKKAPRIHVGLTPAVRGLLPAVDLDVLRPDEIIIQRVGGDLVLTGERPRGSVLAVYTFLEDMAGVRWWTSTDRRVPHRANLALGNWSHRYAPPFRIRDLYYHDVTANPAFAVQLRLNGQYSHLPEEYGGPVRGLGGGHTYWQLLPQKEYFDSHPEYYAQFGGKRQRVTHPVKTALCLTNRDMRKELIRRASERLRRNPKNHHISVSQGDTFNYCECTACREFVKAHGTPADLVLDMVNQVADELRKEFSDVLVDTFAYQYSQAPPKTVKPRPNVLVRLCSIRANFALPLRSEANRSVIGADLRGWSKLTRELGLWNYVANYRRSVFPLPNIRHQADDLRFFAENKVGWVFEQGENWTGRAGELVELRAWLLGHLLWNPYLDQEALINEFLSGFYGPAAPHIRGYIKLLHDEMARHPEVSLQPYRSGTQEDWLSFRKLLEARECMGSARQAVATDPKLSARVRRAGLSIDFLLLARPELSEAGKLLGAHEIPELDFAALLDDSLALAKASGLKRFAEGGSGGFEEMLRSNIRTPDGIPELCRGLKPKDYVIISSWDFELANLNSQVFAQADPKASSGQSWRMPTTHKNWSIAYRFPFVTTTDTWLPYAAVRCDAVGAALGDAFEFGHYHSTRSGHVDIPAEKIAGKTFHYVPLKPIVPIPRMTLYLAPDKGNPTVPQVYVDRIVLIKQ